MLANLKTQIEELIRLSAGDAFGPATPCPAAELDKPKEKAHGDLSTSVALRLAKTLKKNPLAIAGELRTAILKRLEADTAPSTALRTRIRDVEVKAPGFINFFLTSAAYFTELEQIFVQKEDFARADFGKGQKLLLEFVSANPTGPLTVAHARQAAVGDALSRILIFLGYKVKREYYINDEGNQIRILGASIKLRAKEILGEAITFPEDHYQGAYIKDMAQDFIRQNRIRTPRQLDRRGDRDFQRFGVKVLLDLIKKDLKDFGVRFDIWTSQARVATPQNIIKALESIKTAGFIYEQDGATWFKSTALGDDKDRVVRKSDGNYTYLSPDIAYHKNKFDRGFTKLINILGPDHHGYIGRLKAAVEALGHNRNDVEVLIVQLATLFRKGEPLSMSTRKGEFISLREVMDEVGVDAARFFFLMRHMEAHLEFDLELAKQETPENPVYYIQYAHARINSLFKKARVACLKPCVSGFSLLTEPEEIDLIKELISLDDALSICHAQLDPYGMITYLMGLAAAFHRFYDKHRVISEDKKLSEQRLGLMEASRIIFATGLTLLGVSVPKKM